MKKILGYLKNPKMIFRIILAIVILILVIKGVNIIYSVIIALFMIKPPTDRLEKKAKKIDNNFIEKRKKNKNNMEKESERIKNLNNNSLADEVNKSFSRK